MLSLVDSFERHLSVSHVQQKYKKAKTYLSFQDKFVIVCMIPQVSHTESEKGSFFIYSTHEIGLLTIRATWTEENWNTVTGYGETNFNLDEPDVLRAICMTWGKKSNYFQNYYLEKDLYWCEEHFLPLEKMS